MRYGIFWNLDIPSLMIFINFNYIIETIHSYISELQALWNQLASCDVVWPNTEAAKMYANLCDRQHVWYLLMTLRSEFGSIQSSLLHRSPLPKLDTVIKDLISEKARLYLSS